MPGKNMFIASDVVTQSAADTSTEAELRTGLSTGSRNSQMWLIHQIDVLFDPTKLDDIAADDAYVLAQLTTKSESNLVHYDSDHLIDSFGFVQVDHNDAGGTTSVMAQGFAMSKGYSSPIPVVSDSVFIRLMSAGTTVANKVSYRLHYEVSKVSIEDFYKLIRVQS